MPREITQSESNQKLADQVIELFKFAYSRVEEPWEAAKRWRDSYDRIINKQDWNTMSEMMIPFSMVATDTAMAFLNEFLFPRNANTISLRPSRDVVDYAAVERIRDMLENTIRYKMRIKKAGGLTVKDSVKLGVGYGIVESKLIHPENSVTKILELAGQVIQQENVLEDGTPELVESYRYLPFNSVIPFPDGDSPDEVSSVFFLDFKYEDELVAMYDYDASLPASKQVMQNNPSAIIKATIDRRMNGNSRPGIEVLQEIIGVGGVNKQSGVDGANLLDEAHKRKLGEAIVSVPILKCYFRGQHIWLANGDTVILNVPAKKCPIVMAQSNPDSGKWFTPGIVAAAEDPDHFTNVFYNALLDILTHYLHPTRIVDARALPDGVMPPNEPGRDVEVYGLPKDVVSYATPPPLNPGLLSIGQELQQFAAMSKGQPLALQGQASPGLLRGGVGAFESLLTGAFGRQKLMGAMLESGWLESTVIRTLSLSQAITSGKGRKFIAEREGHDGRPEFYEQNVTPDEIRHAYDVFIDLDEKYRNSMSDESMKLQRFSMFRNDPFIDPYASRFDTLGGGEMAKRWLGSRQRVEEVNAQVQERVAQILAEAQAQQIQEQQALAAQQGDAGMTQGEQALAGGASQTQGIQG